MGLGHWAALSPLHHVEFVIYHDAPDKEIQMKKSNQVKLSGWIKLDIKQD